MLKKVMAMVASKYMALKARMRAIETHLMIQSLLLRDRKMVRHLFHRRKCFKHDEMVISNSIATTPASILQVAEEIEDAMESEDDDDDDDDEHPFEDDPQEEEEEEEEEEVHPGSVIEMAKSAKEGQGEEFILEDDIDKVADLFIQRFHHQIAAESPLPRCS